MERTSRFEEWFKLLMLRLHAARTFQERFIALDHATAQVKVNATVCLIHAFDQAAMLVASIPIPPHLRATPKVFCEEFSEVVQMMRDAAAAARASCTKLAGEAKLPPGPWPTVCAPAS